MEKLKLLQLEGNAVTILDYDLFRQKFT
jgi:hypothetical protein